MTRREHIDQLAQRYGANYRLIDRPGSMFTQYGGVEGWWIGRPMFFDGERFNEPTSVVFGFRARKQHAYFTALHELGHQVLNHRPSRWGMAGEDVLREEAQAWLWAVIRHPMAYVQMSQRVRKELGDHPLAGQLVEAEKALVDAEQSVVKAFGTWRALMRVVAEVEPDSTSASRYLKGTTWDLT